MKKKLLTKIIAGIMFGGVLTTPISTNAKTQNSIEKDGENYLRFLNISKEELVDLLIKNGYKKEEVNNYIITLKHDWNKECLDKSNDYLKTLDLSEHELEDLLQNSKFEESEIKYSLSKLNDYNWNQECLDKGNSYLKTLDLSKYELNELLKNSKFKDTEINYAMSKLNNYDWNKECLDKAKSYIKLFPSNSKEELKEYLLYSKFCDNEVGFALNNIYKNTEVKGVDENKQNKNTENKKPTNNTNTNKQTPNTKEKFNVSNYVDKKVYITKSDLNGYGGEINFHLEKHGNMKEGEKWISLAEALQRGFKPCKKCIVDEYNNIINHKQEIINAYKNKYGEIKNSFEINNNINDNIPKTSDIGLLSTVGLTALSGVGFILARKKK